MAHAFKKKFISLVVGISVVLSAIMPFPTRAAFARPGGPGGFPMGHHIVHLGSLIFLFLDGIFFKPGPMGYVVAPAPVGAIIPELPVSAVSVKIEGTPYYTCSGVYYKQVPEGFLVVAQPVVKVETPVAAKGVQLQVQVALLNVRSGPGLGFKIIGQVVKNTMLDVTVSQSNWSKVKLADGSSGWVQNIYTRVITPRAQG